MLSSGDFLAETLQARSGMKYSNIKNWKLSAKNTLFSKVMFHIWRKNKGFRRQSKVEGVNHQQTSLKRNPERSTSTWSENTKVHKT